MPHHSVCLKNLSMYVLSFFLMTTLLSCLALKCCYQLSLNLVQQHKPELHMYIEFIVFYLPIAHVHKNVESAVSASLFKSGLLACSAGPLSPFLCIVGDTMYHISLASPLLPYSTAFIVAIICSSVHFFFFSIAGVCIIADRL